MNGAPSASACFRRVRAILRRPSILKLALLILEGDFAEGDTVEVDGVGGELAFERVGAPAEQAAA